MKRHFLIFTDLDGTLLDERTYSFNAAIPALARLKSEGHTLIFCTSKTFLECQSIQRRLGVEGPLIVENGGGIYLPEAMVASKVRTGLGGWKRIALGIPYLELRRHLCEVREELGLDLIALGDSGEALLQNQCGLTPAEMEEAMQREFDEPFLIPTEDKALIAKVFRAFADRGLQVSQGGRFFHLSGNSDKGRAVHVLAKLIQAGGGLFETVGLGDSPNDIPMLHAVEHPYLVMRPGGFHDLSVLKALFGVKLIRGEGPVGWNQAILELLSQTMAAPRESRPARFPTPGLPATMKRSSDS